MTDGAKKVIVWTAVTLASVVIWYLVVLGIILLLPAERVLPQ